MHSASSSSRPQTSSLRFFAFVCCLLSCVSYTATAMSPLLFTQGHDPCFPSDMPDASICYSTRCYHLFNVSTSGIVPTPDATYPQTYTKFYCTVETYSQYSGYTSAQVCKNRCATAEWGIIS